MRSMTGFGRASDRSGDHILTIEAKSVNHKNLSLSVSLPDNISAMEMLIREEVVRRFSRGRIRIQVRLELAGTDGGMSLNSDAAWAYLAASEKLKAEHGLEGDLKVKDLLALPGVMERSDPMGMDEDQLAAVFETVLSRSLEQLMTARTREGNDLREYFRSGLESLSREVKPVLDGQKASVRQRFERLEKRVAELTADLTLDRDRMLQELAVMAERSDITEEIQRLISHIDYAMEIIEENDVPLGRRLEFTLQEMHREFNTIGAKVDDSDLSVKVIEMKNTLASLREQAANVE